MGSGVGGLACSGLLRDASLHFHVITCMSPITESIQVAEIKTILQASRRAWGACAGTLTMKHSRTSCSLPIPMIWFRTLSRTSSSCGEHQERDCARSNRSSAHNIRNTDEI